jgi:hypothetical protein
MPNLDSIKRHLAPFGRGLMQEMIPGMAAGAIVEMFSNWNVTVAMITEYIQSNKSLWDEMSGEKKRELAVLAQKVGNLDFITPEFLINSIKKDFSGVASLFLNWPEAMEWLERQIEELKSGVNSIKPQSH